jgi:hypothetical protein
MTLIPTPDVYGYTIFCDDIRYEVGGKASFMGSYSGAMIVHVPFPATLPMLAVSITLLQRRKLFIPNVGLRIFLPGDPDDVPSIQAEAVETTDGAIAAATAAGKDALHPDAQTPNEDSYVMINHHLKFGQLVIKQPGILKVRAVVGENMVRLGSMSISPPPEFSASQQN